MIEQFKQSLWQQYGASIQMFENALEMCPPKVWHNPEKDRWFDFWYIAYHTLFYLDFYLSDSPEGFVPPAPFTLSEFSADEYPERVYSKAELLEYLEHCRQKCKAQIASFDEQKITWRFQAWRNNFSLLELALRNMRHVQHHVAQLNMLLRQSGNDAPQWVG
jgi:DinB superfamily